MRAPIVILAALALAGIGASTWVGSRRASGAARMRSDLASAIQHGGIADLGRAQALARWLLVQNPNDWEAAIGLAFTSATLAVDYAVDTAGATDEALARLGDAAALPGWARGMAEAARALALLQGGRWAEAARRAAEAVAAAPGSAHALHALGVARTRAGDLAGASRAFQAAIVADPDFIPARVAWAETRLDLGDAAGARPALEMALARAPKDLRARLLVEEAEHAPGVPTGELAAGACREQAPEPGRASDGAPAFAPSGASRWPPPAIAAACELAGAERARRAGRRAEALTRAAEVARIVPEHPRLLARASLLLAQLGLIDRAAALLDRSQRLAAPEMPAVAWAAAAVAFGRGRAGSVPEGPRPSDPEVLLLLARAALAGGGVGALRAALDGLGKAAVALDVDLGTLARLRVGGASLAPTRPGDPLGSYVDGLRARLRRDSGTAAERLRAALTGHGDACRAAGEYFATLRELKSAPDAAAFAPLRADNARCINLR